MGIHLFTVAQSKNLPPSSCTKNTKYCDWYVTVSLPVSSLVMVEKGVMGVNGQQRNKVLYSYME